MKIKILFLTILFAMLAASLSQIFSIPPYGGDVFRIYKSGYFNELDKSFFVIRDSFLGIKTLSRPEFAWIFLADIEKKQKIKIDVYDRNGFLVPAPGRKSEKNEKAANLVINGTTDVYSYTDGNYYNAFVPIKAEKKCSFCHCQGSKEKILGVIRFNREYDSHVYYSAERIIIFLLLSLVILFFMFFILKWDPENKIKEMFDKS